MCTRKTTLGRGSESSWEHGKITQSWFVLRQKLLQLFVRHMRAGSGSKAKLPKIRGYVSNASFVTRRKIHRDRRPRVLESRRCDLSSHEATNGLAKGSMLLDTHTTLLPNTYHALRGYSGGIFFPEGSVAPLTKLCCAIFAKAKSWPFKGMTSIPPFSWQTKMFYRALQIRITFAAQHLPEP